MNDLRTEANNLALSYVARAVWENTLPMNENAGEPVRASDNLDEMNSATETCPPPAARVGN